MQYQIHTLLKYLHKDTRELNYVYYHRAIQAKVVTPLGGRSKLLLREALLPAVVKQCNRSNYNMFASMFL